VVLPVRPAALAVALLASTSAHAITIACLGDSITQGVALPNVTTPWPTVMDTALGVGYDTTNLGVSGDTTTLLRARYCAQCIAAGPWHYVVFAIGTNDLAADLTATATYARAKEMMDDACNRGFTVIVLPVMPRQFSAPRETERDALNVLYQAWAESAHPSSCSAVWVNVNAVLDADDNGTFDAAYLNGSEFTHPDQDGMQVIADLVGAVIP
jgi:lysophospholipase L1-like esterase